MGNNFLKKWLLPCIVLLLSILIFAGCGAQDEEQSTEGETGASDAEVTDEESGEKNEELFPVTFTDDAGREVIIENEPETIISIQASFTEILFALGLGGKIIGVSDYDNYPEEALEIQKVGGQDMNAELILTLLPDIALVTDYHYNNHPEILEQYEEVGIKVIVIGSATSFEDVYSKIKMIGTATGTQSEAEEITADMKQRLESIKEKAESITDKKKVWVEVSPAPDIFTTGQNTFMHEMLESIQAINAAEDVEGWVKFTEEEIVNLNPDIIITTYGYYIENPKEEVLSRNGWAEVPAVKNDQVFDVDNDMVTRPGPRLIEGVETLAKLIYPKVFNE
ncbi:ABC transporter substrate-binding protein [Virgibacillus profundi]|uniref:ABC transporter substrate-binding protein n=1 Tax=Virgibacillus profundi TaxID=2024555 RepID=A0A2A2I9N6_9BACI|nr:ABC transporter substrate-binding protein [Virgibacillus profundi]PAV27994.1 ABC transporter substrate-binding protein [Virgibacillus profundi]PXY52172.1 ABC transporter substrate-binding protein [Virgibacillus profundi]